MKFGTKKLCMIFFFLVIPVLLNFPLQSSGHILSKYEHYNNIVFAPETELMDQGSFITHISRSRQNLHLAQINNSFIFDPVMINLQLNNATPNYHNNTQLYDPNLKIDLFVSYSTYDLKLFNFVTDQIANQSTNSILEIANETHKIPQNNFEMMDFTVVINPAASIPNIDQIETMIDNSTQLDLIREQGLYSINIDFRLKFSYNSLSNPNLNIKINSLIQRYKNRRISTDLFHNKITGLLNANPVMMHIDRFARDTQRRIYVSIPRDLTSPFLNNTLRTHFNSSDNFQSKSLPIPKIEIRFKLIIFDLTHSSAIDESFNLRFSYSSGKEGQIIKLTSKTSVADHVYLFEYSMQYIPGVNHVLEFDLQNLSNAVDVKVDEVVMIVPPLFFEPQYSDLELVWLFIVKYKYFFIGLGTATALAKLVEDEEEEISDYGFILVPENYISEKRKKSLVIDESKKKSSNQSDIDTDNPLGNEDIENPSVPTRGRLITNDTVEPEIPLIDERLKAAMDQLIKHTKEYVDNIPKPPADQRIKIGKFEPSLDTFFWEPEIDEQQNPKVETTPQRDISSPEDQINQINTNILKSTVDEINDEIQSSTGQPIKNDQDYQDTPQSIDPYYDIQPLEKPAFEDRTHQKNLIQNDEPEWNQANQTILDEETRRSEIEQEMLLRDNLERKQQNSSKFEERLFLDDEEQFKSTDQSSDDNTYWGEEAVYQFTSNRSVSDQSIEETLEKRQDSSKGNEEDDEVSHPNIEEEEEEGLETDIIDVISALLRQGLSIDDVARITGIDRNYLFYLVNNGKLSSNQNLINPKGFEKIKDELEKHLMLPSVVIPNLMGINTLNKIYRVDKKTEELDQKSKPLKLKDGTVSTDYVLIEQNVSLLDLHSEILIKLAYYAKYLPIETSDPSAIKFKNGKVVSLDIDGRQIQITVADILGEAAEDIDIYNLLGKWFKRSVSDYNFSITAGQQIEDADPELRYILENIPRSVFGELYLNTIDFERIQHIWNETAMVALLVSGRLKSGILKSIKVPISPAISRILKDKDGKKSGVVSWNATGVGSDILFTYNYDNQLPDGTFLQGSIENKHRSLKKGDKSIEQQAYILREDYRESLYYGQANEGPLSKRKYLEMGPLIVRSGDLYESGETFQAPSRYASEINFGIMDLSRIGNDLQNHFGITNHATDPKVPLLWKKNTPSSMMIVAAYNAMVANTDHQLAKTTSNILSTDKKELDDAVVTIKQRLNTDKIGKKGMDTPKCDSWILESPVFNIAMNIKNLFETRIKEDLLFEVLYSGRVFKSSMFTIDTIPAVNRGRNVLTQLNNILRKRWSRAFGKTLNEAPEVLILEEMENLYQFGDQSVEKRINPLARIILEIFPRSINEPNDQQFDIQQFEPRIISVHVLEFWYLDPSTGLLGIRDPEFSYYTVTPEDFIGWMTHIPENLPYGSKDGSNEKRTTWYVNKVKELTRKQGKDGALKDGEWTKLMLAKLEYESTLTEFGQSALETENVLRNLVNSRKEFMRNAPTEGVLRELQQALLRKLIRNNSGGLRSSFSSTPSGIYKPYFRIYMLLGSESAEYLQKVLSEMGPGLSSLARWDYIGFSSSAKSMSVIGNTKNNQIMAVTGNIVKVAHTKRIRKMSDFKELVDYLVDELGLQIYKWLNPSRNDTKATKAQLKAQQYFLKRTQGKYTRMFNQTDYDLVTGKKLTKDGKILDGRKFASNIIDLKTHHEIFHGFEVFLKDTFDLSSNKKYQVSYTSESNNVLKRYLNVQRADKKGDDMDQKPIHASEVINNGIWYEVVENRKSFIDSYTASDGIEYRFSWSSIRVNGKDIVLKRLSYYFFGNKNGKVNFSTLRGRGFTKGVNSNANYYVNTDEIGVAWYLIINAILQNMYELPKSAADETLRALSDKTKGKLPWIEKKSNGEWDVGSGFLKLLHDVEPKNYKKWMAAHRVINDTVNRIEVLDKTGWISIARGWDGVGTGKKHPSWIKRELDGLPSNDREITRLAHAKAQWTDQQIEAVKLGILYIIDTLERYVGSSVIKLNDIWKLDRTPSIDQGYIKGAPMISILSENEAIFLRKILEMLASNNFELPKDFRSILG